MGIPNLLKVLWPLLAMLSASAFGDQKVITAESGQNVTLPCRAQNNINIPIIVVEWTRADLEPEYVLLHRDGQFDPEEQHPSFKNRVDLQDRQMKDGDVSLILKNVTISDAGTYECRVIQRGTNRRKRANLDTELISIISLRVDPPGPPGGQRGLAIGLPLFALVAVAAVVVGFVIYKKPKRQDSYQLPDKEQSSEMCQSYLRLNSESPAAVPNS